MRCRLCLDRVGDVLTTCRQQQTDVAADIDQELKSIWQEEAQGIVPCGCWTKNRGKTPKMDGENNGKAYENGWFGGSIIFGNTHVGQELHHIFPPWCHLRLFQFVGHVKNPVCVMRLRVAQTRNFTARIKDITKWIQWSMKWRRACRPWREVLDLSAPQLYCLVGVRSVLDSSKTRYSHRTTNSIDFSQTKSKEMKTWHLVHQSWGSFPGVLVMLPKVSFVFA